MPLARAELQTAAPSGEYHGPDGLAEALAAVGDRWSLAIVRNLLDGPLRFGAMQRQLPEISPNVLSQRLRALQAAGLILATPYSRRPARYLYELTSAGAELAAPLRLLEEWGSRRAGVGADAPRHSACETPLQMRWYCPACEEPVTEGEGATSSETELYFA
ncbi:MAG TPA: helix-turn-helix domain-containing protein [Solirubrobacteraceae bacterium]|jgi:DNA-binding HxlR family transcriptional regulator|nr:helix-turn-helix domain-containing protein [Solirubrobacteraceae bacterium]